MTVQKVSYSGLMPVRAGSAVVLALGSMLACSANAQDAAPAAQAAPKPAAAQKAPAQKAAPAAPAAAAAGSSDAGLRQRVEQLEEQIVDMQVVIGTLESLAKAPQQSPVAARNTGPTSGADSARVQSLEAQVQSLNSQLQQLSMDMKAQRGGDRRSELPVGSPPAPQAPQPGTTGTVSSFGSTTVTSGAGAADPIGGFLATEPPPAKVGEALPDIPGSAPGPAASAAPGAAPGPIAALPPAEAVGEPQQMYSSAYGQLLGQNYGAAQAGFEEFLRKHARDALAPDALFWLGEAHYMQKNYGDAAEAFDLVTASYASSSKAPEAQVRRAAALVQLGRKEDACAALRQLNTKYPNARPVLKTKADAERQRAGCT
jgi:tol-pal system protein YbgF